MRKLYFASTLLLSLALGLQAQNQRLAQPNQLAPASVLSGTHPDEKAHQNTSATPYRSVSKADRARSTLNGIPMGTASNVYSIVRPYSNQVTADNPTGMVSFIHRQDIATWGGSSGTLRYDCSMDKGQTWSIDQGPLNPALAQPARYPNLTHYIDPQGQVQLNYLAATLSPTNAWDGMVHGAICDQCGPNQFASENYNFSTQDGLIAGGLCEGLPGEFWAAEFASDGQNTLDSIFLYKGTAANCNTSWSRVETFQPNWNLGSTGNPVAIGPVISFSPDGMYGYMVAIGDIQSGATDSILTPVISQTTDGGTTWSQPTEISLSHIPWISDSLQSFWVQEGSNNNFIPVSAGKYTCTSQFDAVVDADGNLHLFDMIASGFALDSDSVVIPVPPYSIYPGLAKMFVDIYTTDQGQTWDARYIAPGMAWQGEFGQTNTETFSNYCQVSRDESGNRIFYSWVDQDSSAGLFGVSDLIAPNLRIAASRITDGYQTCWKMITDGDFIWDGRLLCPNMAPTVLDYGATYMLPIVAVELVNNDVLQQVRFHYFGRDALIFESDFQDPASLDLGFAGACFGVGIGPDPNPIGLLTVEALWPNPTADHWQLRYQLSEQASVSAELYDVQGRKVRQWNSAEVSSGEHDLQMAATGLDAGIYLLRLTASGAFGTQESVTRRLALQP